MSTLETELHEGLRGIRKNLTGVVEHDRVLLEWAQQLGRKLQATRESRITCQTRKK